VPKDSCPYFTLTVGHIPMPGQSEGLRVPICRCVLTETLVRRLRTHPNGRHLASYLEGPPLEDQPRPIIGSDLQPVSPVTCTNSRRQISCQPSFIVLLTDFTLDPTFPPEEPSPVSSTQ
jgi:hypothetical protein